jgi:hypothetical protein
VSTSLNWTAGPLNTGVVMLPFVHGADRRAERIHLIGSKGSEPHRNMETRCLEAKELGK